MTSVELNRGVPGRAPGWRSMLATLATTDQSDTACVQVRLATYRSTSSSADWSVLGGLSKLDATMRRE